jgi:hypothetical protein
MNLLMELMDSSSTPPHSKRQKESDGGDCRAITMLSDPIDLRIYLTDAEFRKRVLQSKAWAEFLRLPSITPFDEVIGLAEIENRNLIRANNHLPLLNVQQEIARLREHYESSTCSDRFYSLASDCIREIYGPLKPSDFNSLSAMRGFVAHKQCLIRGLMSKRNGSRQKAQ